MNNPKNWNIEGGIEAYKNSASLQNKSFAMLANKNIKYGAKANSTLTSGAQVAKFLKMAHLKGAGNAANGMLNPEFDKKDGNGTSMQAYGNGAARDLNKFIAEVSAAMPKVVKPNPLYENKKANAGSVLPLPTKNVNFTSSSVATPKIVQPSSIKLSSPIVPILAPNSIKVNDQPTGYRSNNLSQTSTSLPHKPLNRRVDHQYIAWMASGGTGMG